MGVYIPEYAGVKNLDEVGQDMSPAEARAAGPFSRHMVPARIVKKFDERLRAEMSPPVGVLPPWKTRASRGG
ncbi:hypothetical protein A5755_13615 [Mycolicibacterium fortuitum]|nr:hypothetical protein A5763_28270 [Mycolicibacterium fortuitum]OBB51073.1 hypothetical protein A5754_25720 [Mycolicibacterium fortuitum]OBB76102.1 hypothetical protein A5755_13615 [Mycolicibacterium fortuitum]OBF73797.1 hypothetical protein A5751_28435 [Mycolicibacterium fortuitum]OBG18311.1 hypothetical protein A5768_31675 [Mycolicibacterium fortuitum]